MPATEANPRDGLLELVGGELELSLVGGEWVRYANLDNAASAPALTRVADVVAELLPGYVLPDPDPRPRPSLGGLLSGPVAGGESPCRA